MLIFCSVIIAIIFALLKVKKIPIPNLNSLEIKYIWCLFVACLLRFIILLTIKTNFDIYNKYNIYFLSFNSLSLLFCLLFLIVNYDLYKDFIWAIIGLSMNILAIISNKGKMPVDSTHMRNIDTNGIEELLKNNKLPFHSLLNKDTIFPYFSDVIPLTHPTFYPSVISVGDIFLSIGIYLFIYHFIVNCCERR